MGLVHRKGRSKPKEQVVPAKSGIKKAEFDLTKKKEVGVSDLTLLSHISDDAINENLHKRFMNGTIYTYIGHVLISVNPFQDLGIYTPQTLNMYKGKNRLEVPPHVFAIAETMYYSLKSYGENQCVIISGESGAGKTEAAKQIMQYIANVSASDSATNSGITKIKNMVLATNPLLESFGCAKTLRNNNSSRHGKYLEIYFDTENQPSAAHITNYLLEKQRVVLQIQNERNFHIFYQFTKNCHPQYRLSFGIQGPETYVYTSAARCVDADGIDDAKDFKETLEAMAVIGLSQPEQDNIFRMLATILWIGNISFVENDDGYAQVHDEKVTNFVAYLLQVEASLLVKSLVERTLTTSHGQRRGSTYQSPLNIVQATATRDALAKGIYNNLFEWIVERVNVSLKPNSQEYEKKSVGILDIYGFEIFDQNSFEQICINYINEKLQQIFIELTLKAEQEEYIQEQITWTPIDYFNNKVVCDLIEATRPNPGLFAALNDSIKTAHADSDQADQVFAQRLVPLSERNKHFQDRRGGFIIKHYAGDVSYEVTGMTDKNKDNMLRDLLELLSCSQNSFIEELFPSRLLAALSDSKKRPETASDKIKRSANALVDTLSQCQPSYIRTIKPNLTKRPKEYNNQQVLHQVKYLGLKENVRIRRAGFAYRTTFDKFVQRFYLLSPNTGYAGSYIWQGDDISAVKEILRSCYIPESEYQLGTTKVFVKQPETLFALEGMRDKFWDTMAARIQRAWRRYVQRKVDAAVVIQRAWKEKKHGNKFEQIRDKGSHFLGARKERRRMSMLGSRAYMGDYLGCNYLTGYGRYLVSLSGILDEVYFSGEGEILLAKFGRSSKRLPRSFVLTKTTLYVLAQELVEKRPQIQKEFIISLAGVASVGMSNLQDDWMAICMSNDSTSDLFVNLPLKTELATRMKILLPMLKVNVGPDILYQKKPGKLHKVKFVTGTAPERGDVYKSGTVTVLPGLSPTSVNPRKPRGIREPVDYSKYYNRSARSGYRQPQTQRYQPQTQQKYQYQQLPQVQQPRQIQQPQRQQFQQQPQQETQKQLQPQPPQRPQSQRPQPQSVKKVAPAPPAKKSAPPPPPALAVAKPKHPTYKVLYNYDGSVAGTLPLVKDDIVYVVSVNGAWGLVKDLNETKEGWAPINYMKEFEVPGHKAPPKLVSAPTTAPSPAQEQNPNASGNGDGSRNGIGATLSAGLANALNAKKCEDVSMAGSLAEALKKRQVTREESGDEDDDW